MGTLTTLRAVLRKRNLTVCFEGVGRNSGEWGVREGKVKKGAGVSGEECSNQCLAIDELLPKGRARFVYPFCVVAEVKKGAEIRERFGQILIEMKVVQVAGEQRFVLHVVIGCSELIYFKNCEWHLH